MRWPFQRTWRRLKGARFAGEQVLEREKEQEGEEAEQEEFVEGDEDEDSQEESEVCPPLQ